MMDGGNVITDATHVGSRSFGAKVYVDIRDASVAT